MKRLICFLLVLCMVLSMCACGGSGRGYGVNVVQTLVEQDYSLAFRNNDPLYFYVTAAISVLAAQGKVDALAIKWLGSPALNFAKQADALDLLQPPEPQNLIIGVDINSFPMAYVSNGEYWGLDVELAMATCELLGWTLKIQPIEKENVYIELSSGNIDGAVSPSILRILKTGFIPSMVPISITTSSSPRETVPPSGTSCVSTAERCACPPPPRPERLCIPTSVCSSAWARSPVFPTVPPSALSTSTPANATLC